MEDASIKLYMMGLDLFLLNKLDNLSGVFPDHFFHMCIPR